jgi:hypothetical protein
MEIKYMELFISWSGDLSKKIAKEIKEWIPCVIQAVSPYYAPDDIEKGSRWNSEISTKLESAQMGIILLTQQNLNAPWLMFEAGALSKNIKNSSVCPILFGVTQTDIEGPLLQFQSALFSKDEMLKLLKSINLKIESNRLSDHVLSSTFELRWPELKKKINDLLSSFTADQTEHRKIRSDRDLIEELLRLTRKLTYRKYHSKSEKQFSIFKNVSPVTFDPEEEWISFWEDEKEVYEFPIERMASAAQVLDWIFQINPKKWCSPFHLKAFIRCLDQISDMYFGINAQALFCPMGVNNKVDWSEVLTKRST